MIWKYCNNEGDCIIALKNGIKIVIKYLSTSVMHDIFYFDKDKVRIHHIGEQRFTLCHIWDKIIEHKKILVPKMLIWKFFKVWNSEICNWRGLPRW